MLRLGIEAEGVDPGEGVLEGAFGAGSVSEAAADYGRQRGIAVIDGGCPLMFDPTADLGHKAMRFVFTLRGKVPKEL